jgi:hypothetical protein
MSEPQKFGERKVLKDIDLLILEEVVLNINNGLNLLLADSSIILALHG